jgi:hypothetical protein
VLRITASAWRATRSAIDAKSLLIRFTSANLSSLRRFKLALIDRARDRTVRVRSANRVRVANPITCNRFTVRAILATPLANRPESDG